MALVELTKDDRVRGSQIDTQSTRLCTEQEDEKLRAAVGRKELEGR
jgi:hypothetical protein